MKPKTTKVDIKYSKPIQSDTFLLEPGARRNLHPKLSILDTIECEVYYSKSLKCLYMYYDKRKGKFQKGFFSTDFNNVIKIVEEYINSYEMKESGA